MDLSAGWLFASFGVSTLGFGFFLYGKRQLRIPQLVAGIAMVVYPYFVSSPLWILCIAGALLFGLWLSIRAGM